MDFYAPRTTYANVIYNNKKYKFLFQEKLVKEFLEYNSLQEGLFYAGDERFSFKYEKNKKVDGKIIDDVVDFPLYTAGQENQLVSDASPDEVVD